jgi:hypothetical protein
MRARKDRELRLNPDVLNRYLNLNPAANKPYCFNDFQAALCLNQGYLSKIAVS